MTFVNDMARDNSYSGSPEKRTELRLIICEGHSDKNVIAALMKEHNLGGIQIHIAKGRDNFTDALRGARTQGYKAVLVVSDNDDDSAAAFTTVRDHIVDAGFSPPDTPRQTVAATAENPSLAVLMIPWDGISGAIETLCLPAVEKLFADKVACLDAFCECTKVDQYWGVTKRSEMRVECLLACTQQSEPKIGLGHFVSRNACPLAFGHDCFANVSAFLAEFSKCPV